MTTLNPYLNFSGNCGEAMNFYKDCLKGQLTVQTYGEVGMDVPENLKGGILHSELRADDLVLQASDGRPGETVKFGDNVTLALNFTDVQEQQHVFDALGQDGHIDQSLQDTFWGARFGMLTDKFGVHWLMNCQTKPA